MSGFLLRDVRLVALTTPADREPVDVLVRDGHVAGIGHGLDATGVPSYAGEGRWLVPGLWDQHVHLGQWTLTAGRLDLTGTGDLSEALAVVRGRLAASDGPVIGWGQRPAPWPEQPTVSLLDEVAGDRPVVLIAGDGHHAWCSTAALDTLGLPRREAMVEETEWFAVYPLLAELLGEDGTSPAGYLATQRAAAARGIVGVTDLEFGMGPDEWPARSAAGATLLRIRVGAYAERLDDHLALGLRTGDVMGGDPLVTMGPLKVISDGSLNTRTAWCHEPYADLPTAGAANLSVVDLEDLLARATGAGLAVAVHAIGDAAVGQALDAIGGAGAHGSVEHAQLVSREDIPRMAALGLRASVQPAHLLDDRDVTHQCWPDREDRCFPLRSLLDAGVELALGSDAPVAPLDPWLAMAAAVHRSGDHRDAWHPEQSLTAREALAASVDGQGTVHIGMPADLALLDADPLAVHPTTAETAAHLRRMTVAETWIAGRGQGRLIP